MVETWKMPALAHYVQCWLSVPPCLANRSEGFATGGKGLAHRGWPIEVIGRAHALLRGWLREQ